MLVSVMDLGLFAVLVFICITAVHRSPAMDLWLFLYKQQKVLAPVPGPGWCGGTLVKHGATLGWAVLMRLAVRYLNTTFTIEFRIHRNKFSFVFLD